MECSIKVEYYILSFVDVMTYIIINKMGYSIRIITCQSYDYPIETYTYEIKENTVFVGEKVGSGAVESGVRFKLGFWVGVIYLIHLLDRT